MKEIINYVKENIEIHYNGQTKMWEIRLGNNYFALSFLEEGKLAFKTDFQVAIVRPEAIEKE